MDKSGANKAGINTINLQLALLFMMGGVFLPIKVRQIKYLNNIGEQDHRFIKKITKPMKGFKAFHSDEVTLSGIELHHMLRKQQHQARNQSIFQQFYEIAHKLAHCFYILILKILCDKTKITVFLALFLLMHVCNFFYDFKDKYPLIRLIFRRRHVGHDDNTISFP